MMVWKEHTANKRNLEVCEIIPVRDEAWSWGVGLHILSWGWRKGESEVGAVIAWAIGLATAWTLVGKAARPLQVGGGIHGEAASLIWEWIYIYIYIYIYTYIYIYISLSLSLNTSCQKQLDLVPCFPTNFSAMPKTAVGWYHARSETQWDMRILLVTPYQPIRSEAVSVGMSSVQTLVGWFFGGVSLSNIIGELWILTKNSWKIRSEPVISGCAGVISGLDGPSPARCSTYRNVRLRGSGWGRPSALATRFSHDGHLSWARIYVKCS